MNRKQLKQKALVNFNAKYWICVGVFFLNTAIMGALAGTGIGAIASLIIAGPLAGGLTAFMLNITRGKEGTFEDLFSGFNRFGQFLGTSLLQSIFVFLWSLLFIIPGIIKALAYSQAIYIAYENPGMSATEALKKSEEMMKGHKWELFVLMLSFLGWMILSLFTFGLLHIFYVTPYQNLTLTEYYEQLKPQEEIVEEEENNEYKVEIE